jgi:DDE superfamily endonuclease
VATAPRSFQIGRGHSGLYPEQPHPSGNRRVARRVPANDKQGGIGHYPAARGIAFRIRPTADELADGGHYFVDGTLLPCWTWRAHPELRSGKHKATGMKVLLACTPDGRPAWISDPVNGKRHDMHILKESGLLDETDPTAFCGDAGFEGSGMITPYRKPYRREFEDWQKEYNKSIAKIRWVVEQAIANFKAWRIMHTDYRRPLKTFETTISAVVGLHFYRTA